MVDFNDEEKIYIGMIPMYLYACTGIYRNFNFQNTKKEEINEKNIETIIKRTKDISYFNQSYKDIYFQCIPETEITQKCNLKEENISENGPEEFLFHPYIKFLLKIRKDTKEYEKISKLNGVMSGERSAIIKAKNGKFYRLKGCGDYKKGFTSKDNGFDFKKINIWGCQLKNNAVRELYYTYKINEILKKNNIEVSNIPIGFWKYSHDLKFIDDFLNEKNVIENFACDIDKYCTIYETISDKRLGNHLLKGIEILIESIVKVSIEEFNFDKNDLENLKKIYIGNNKFEEKNYKPKISLPENVTLKEFCKNKIYEKKYFDRITSYSKLIELMTTYESLKKIVFSSNLIEKWSKILESKLNVTFDYYSDIINHLLSLKKKENNNKSILEYLLDIFIRIGYETAKIKRIFQEIEFNWGSFNGQSPVDLFCSSHYNNFIVLPKSKCSLLSPTDFDMSFSKGNFINTDVNSISFKTFDQKVFDEYLIRELNTLLENLGGIYIYKNIEFEDEIKQYTYNLLNESLIEMFMKTFDGIKSNYLIEFKNFSDIHHDLIKISLISTSHNIS